MRKAVIDGKVRYFAFGCNRCGMIPEFWSGDYYHVVFEVRLIVGQRKSHVFSQPPAGYSRISTAPLAPSCGYTRIKGRPLIEPLIDVDHGVIRAIRAPSVYKKVLPT